jgi:hypothetical protein
VGLGFSEYTRKPVDFWRPMLIAVYRILYPTEHGSHGRACGGALVPKTDAIADGAGLDARKRASSLTKIQDLFGRVLAGGQTASISAPTGLGAQFYRPGGIGNRAVAVAQPAPGVLSSLQ